MEQYPFNNIKGIISKREAKYLLIKFLKQNRCFGEYIEAWKAYHNGLHFSVDDIMEATIRSIIMNYRGNFRYVFFSSYASFGWKYANKVLNQQIIWSVISNKWESLFAGKNIQISEYKI